MIGHTTTEEYAAEGRAFRFLIEAPPRTKKNSPQMVIRRNKKTGQILLSQKTGQPVMFPVPSKAATEWSNFAEKVIRAQAMNQGYLRAWDKPVNCRVLVMADSAGYGDLINYCQAIADVLELSKIVLDDKLIVAWDGSDIGVSYVRPRVEITLTPRPTPQMRVELEPDADAKSRARNRNRLNSLDRGKLEGYPLAPRKARHAPVLTTDRELYRKLRLPPIGDGTLPHYIEQPPSTEAREIGDLVLEGGHALTPQLQELLRSLNDPHQ